MLLWNLQLSVWYPLEILQLIGSYNKIFTFNKIHQKSLGGNTRNVLVSHSKSICKYMMQTNSFDNFTMKSVVIIAIVEFLNDVTNFKFQVASWN